MPRPEVDAVRADLLIDNERTKDRQVLLEAVLRDDKKSAPAHKAVGSLKFREGDVPAAKKWYGKAVQLEELGQFGVVAEVGEIWWRGVDPRGP